MRTIGWLRVMLRRFNSTGRGMIPNGHAAVRLLPVEKGGERCFELTLTLDEHRFAEDAEVRVEAWRSNIGERWQLGGVGQIADGAQYVRRMDETPDGSQFRVVVVAGDGSGKLLGATAPMKPKLPVESLIALQEEDLGDEVWRVSFGDDSEPPLLLVNNKIEMISEIVRSDAAFRSLVMPQVLRTVLTQIVFVLGEDPDDDEERWCQDWYRLAQSILPESIPKAPDRGDTGEQAVAEDWVRRVVEEFASQKVQAAQSYQAASQAKS